MRITRRDKGVREYWSRRWANIPVDEGMSNESVYPLKYALRAVSCSGNGPILEAGCGNGRILRYFHDRGCDIVGIDYVEIAVIKLREADRTLKVQVADITALPFHDEVFSTVLSFGLYHNLEFGLESALAETFRILEPGGLVCASFRADNFQNLCVDFLSDRSTLSKKTQTPKAFHKINLKRGELVKLFRTAGFIVESVKPVENMPLLYRFRYFRAVNQQCFEEHLARRTGYQLSQFGRIIQKLLVWLLPNQFCSLYLINARRP